METRWIGNSESCFSRADHPAPDPLIVHPRGAQELGKKDNQRLNQPTENKMRVVGIEGNNQGLTPSERTNEVVVKG